MKPKRIQRKRTKGWRMPENTVDVGRPYKWSNPMKIINDIIYIDTGYKILVKLDRWQILEEDANIFDMLHFFYGMLTDFPFEKNTDLWHWQNHFKKLDLSELKGKNLACWCPLDRPCHADILSEIANK